MNILDYVRSYGSFSFAERPFGRVDSLILAQLSYLDYQGTAAEESTFSLTLSALLASDSHPALVENTLTPEENIDLLFATARSSRFGDLALGYFINTVDLDHEMQFSALVFRLAPQQ